MYYGWFDGGKAKVTLSETEYNGKKVFHSKLTAHTIGLADRLYKVYDIYESYFDPETDYSLKSIRNISEGSYKKYNVVEYHRDEDSVTSSKSGKHSVPEDIMDVLGALYRLRNQLHSMKLQYNDTIFLDTYFDDEMFTMNIRYKGIEKIKTDLGEIECLKFMPIVGTGRIFKTEDDMQVYVSNDKNYVPIRVRFDLLIGSIKCDLISYSTLKYPIKFR